MSGNITGSGKGEAEGIPPEQVLEAGNNSDAEKGGVHEDNMATMWNRYACGGANKVSLLRNEEPEGLNPGASINIVEKQAEIGRHLSGL